MKIKELINLGWLLVAGFVVYMLTKIFGKPSENEIISNVQQLGLTQEETYYCTKVHALIEQENTIYGTIISLMNPASSAVNLVEISQILEMIVHRDLFSQLYYKMYNKTLSSAIIEAFGEERYNILVEHVENFYEFC